MCGLSGICSFDDRPTLQQLSRMLEAVAHRGPDQNGYYRDHHVALGQTRLSIFDERGGSQPMMSQTGRFCLVFNGEIYNYKSLRKQLRAHGHVFVGESDTEVLVHAWDQWGLDCAARLQGQWAFAVWDYTHQKLYLSRDRLGIHPLYFTIRNRQIRFASEVKALFADPSVRRAFDPVGIGQILTYWSTVAPRTPFCGVSQLPPGYIGIYDRTGLTARPYWENTFGAVNAPSHGTRADRVVAIREDIKQAVRARITHGQAPVGAYVSGGVDSTIIAALGAQYTDGPLRTFSLRFNQDDLDEGRYQAEVVRGLGSHHSEVNVTPGAIAGVFRDVVRHTESPVLRAAPASMYLLSRHVGEQVLTTVEK